MAVLTAPGRPVALLVRPDAHLAWRGTSAGGCAARLERVLGAAGQVAGGPGGAGRVAV
ncbi:hypothetical protein GCM10023225_19640 [Kineococcus glutinatus]|uniref:Monooxygenase n=1 Tax=Kineococcus glutinatus TaxID=1070872 RepID=A0ABP9HUU4_9ACTN